MEEKSEKLELTKNEKSKQIDHIKKQHGNKCAEIF